MGENEREAIEGVLSENSEPMDMPSKIFTCLECNYPLFDAHDIDYILIEDKLCKEIMIQLKQPAQHCPTCSKAPDESSYHLTEVKLIDLENGTDCFANQTTEDQIQSLYGFQFVWNLSQNLKLRNQLVTEMIQEEQV